MISIKKPTLLLNEETCRKNLSTIAAKAREEKVIFRPHFKTHQSAAIGEWYRKEGVSSITVSSVSMAGYFARYGWTDITIAFPVNILEIEEINQLASCINLHLLIESDETAAFLVNCLSSECGFFIKVDTGYHRSGVDPSDSALINKILALTHSLKLHFEGFLTHSGHAYHAGNLQELIQIQQVAAKNLLDLKMKYLPSFPGLIVSTGDTPTCSQLPTVKGIDEIRPGNFVFFDLMQFALGSCTLEEIAVALVCPVVAVYQSRRQAVIYGGAVHLSKEHTMLHAYPDPIFGMAVYWDGENWDTGSILGMVSGLSQEHGIISLTGAGFNLNPGDLVAIIPVHSCLTANLLRNYYKLNGERIETMNS